MKPKINKGVCCIYYNERVSKELCSKCNIYDRYISAENTADLYRKKCSKINGKKHKVTKATDIPTKLKKKVWERDNHKCIFCRTPVSWHYANSHYIKRSQLGLGIEENIMTNCERCHKLFEETSKRDQMKIQAKEYFISLYPNWNEDKLVYKKYRD